MLHFSTSSSRYTRAAAVAGMAVAGCLEGCAPTVNLATPHPLTANINVRLDVYEKTSPTKLQDEQSSLEISKNRRLRSGEIQQLKNDAVIGENREGYLELRRKPADPKYLEYANSVVNAENADRSFLYLANAQSQSKPLEEVESQYAQLWQQLAFPGEWVQNANGNWIRK
jgi:uncharacterized protein YdbL (DUF1318 family)